MSPDGTHTYGDLRLWSHKAAALLQCSRGEAGDRVLLAGSNSLFWVAAYLGTMLAGRIVVPIPPDTPPESLAHIMRVTGARDAFVQQDFASTHRDALGDVSVVTQHDLEDVATEFEPSSVGQPSPDTLAALMFTSGSTGKPRGVMISHRNILANTESIVQYLGLTSQDRMMAVLPFHYCFGASLLHTHLYVGGSLAIEHSFMFPELFLRRLRETECTGLAGVPSHYHILLRRSSMKHMNFPSLRHVQQAGGHLPPPMIAELREALPQAQVFVMYGQTEATARLSYLPPNFLDSKKGSIGRGIPGVRLTVVDESGAPVQAGQPGEIVAEGANIGLGYWDDPEETAKYFRDGRLHTGDMATVDEDGFIYIVGRSKDFVKCGSKRVSCSDIEDRLLACTDLVEVAAIGMQDSVLGEAVKLFVVPRDPHRLDIHEAVRAFCKESLPYQLQPRVIVVLESLPKNGAGKIMKSALKEAS